MNKHVYLALLLYLVSGVVFAQSAAVIDEILAEQRMSYGSAAFLILGSVGEIEPDADRAQAVQTLEQRYQGIPDREPESALTLGEYSLLLMQVLEIEGGFIFSLTSEPRYAARDLSFLGVLQGRAFPGMSFDGARGLRILNRALELREEGRI